VTGSTDGSSRSSSVSLVRAVLAALALASAAAHAGVGQERSEEGAIDSAQARHEQGFCYTVAVTTPSPPDSMAGVASFLRLLEDGLPLGPAHSMHQTIRDVGAGAYSHWAGDPEGTTQVLYYSASDNSDPTANGRRYTWAVVYDPGGKPLQPGVDLCRLRGVPDGPLGRDRDTCLYASFDAVDTSNAEYARVEPREVGIGSQPDAPGRFGGGVAVEGPEDCVMYPGLDNYSPLTGTLEFWAQSRGEQPIWTDGREHWLLVLYPERGGASPRYGMAPYFVALRKTADNTLELRIVNVPLAHYAVGPGLATSQGWSLSCPSGTLSAEGWHHVLVSWDLRGSGRAWLLVDGEGATGEIGLPAGHPRPNPGGCIVFGGLWGLPGDNVRTSDCNLDDLRIESSTVAARLDGGTPPADPGIDVSRLIGEEELARAMLDKLLELQSHGGWASSYHWPTYTPTGWSLVGRGVDMWFPYTVEAAQALLRGWMIWGDDRYLDGAIEAADMFCITQMENGSWAYHYTYSRGEFEPWSQAAYIAQSMQSNQIRFLCLMSKRLGYERYDRAIRKAGDWMASIQFPSGAWGWETYPLGHTGPYGHPALNDAVTPQAMADLFVIWCATGDDRYLRPILNGAGWTIDAQADAPTYGWADQYDESNRFVWMRSFEPPAVSMQAISSAAWGLCQAYDLTGDDKYLEPLRKVLGWMTAVPEDQRGWLWYDPATQVPVVAYYNEMLPVTDEKAISEIIPRLDAHYGTKFPWQADRIAWELRARENGPVYPDCRGVRPTSDFGQAPAVEEFAAAFRGDAAAGARDQLAAWSAGAPRSGVLGGTVAYGRTFEIGNAVAYCEQLLSDVEGGRVALGDIAADSIPRYGRTGNSNWVYMDPQRDYVSDARAAIAASRRAAGEGGTAGP